MKKFLLVLSLMFLLATSALAVSCGAKTYSISFDTDGGASISAAEVEPGQEYVLPTPEREGYSFEGWYLSEDFSGDAVASVTPTGDMTVYAKWEQLGAITLELNGGSLDAGTTLYLKSGEVIYDFMQDYIPSKSGFTFGAWFYGDKELARNERMPQEGITLRAEYKVEYTVELWTQTLTLDGYEKTGSVSDSDYVGTTVAPEETVTGFRRVAHGDEVSQLVLTESAEDNVLKLYFDREVYTVRFLANYPDGSSAADDTRQVYYGEEVELPVDYSFEGYFLSGWATSADGEPAYKLNHIDSLIYNKEGGAEAQTDTFTPERNMALYAVWNKGYTDMFGGDDYIFLFEEDAADVYLCRGDVYFKGEYDAQSRQFNFIDDTLNELMAQGRLNEDGTFSYYNESRGYTATLYVVGQGLVDDTRIVFDGYNGITYTVQDESGYNSNSQGEYSIDEDGYYHVAFESGDLAGQTLVISVGSTEVDGASRPAFMVRNEEHVALGTLVRFAIADGAVVYYREEYLGITLNGFETAVMNNGDSSVSYRYVMNEDGTQFTLLSTYGIEAGVVRIVEFNGMKGYMLYMEEYDRTYTGTDGGTLVLDGLYNATYTNGSVTETGYYSIERSSVFGGDVISVVSAQGQERVFIVESETIGSGEEEVTVDSYVEKPIGYSEYQYQSDGSIYYAPLIVLNDHQDGWASLYGYNVETQEYLFISQGTYEYDPASELYLFTVVGEPVDAEVSATFVDLTAIKSIIFAVTITTASNDNIYYVNYWHSAVIETEDGTAAEEEYAQQYTCTNVAGGKLTLVGGFAVLEQSGNRYVGAYSSVSGSENVIGIAVTNNGTVSGYLYVETDPETLTYYFLQTAPYTARVILADGTTSAAETMQFDGKGGAVYTSGEEEHIGTFQETGATAFGMTVYTFTADGMQFDFVLASASNVTYFAKYNQEIGRGTYASETAGILELDGFGFGARYTAPDGSNYTGMYFFSSDEISEKVLVLYTSSGYFFFDYTDTDLTSFTVRGEEYGNFLFLDNQMFLDRYVRLDGYGNAAVFTVVEDEISYIDESGSYTVHDDGSVTVTYQEDASTELTVFGSLRVYSIGGSETVNVFVIHYSEFVRVYVNRDDWSVLMLDGYGNVTRYDGTGKAESGTYTVITDDLLYYANAAGTDASLYTYDNADGTMSPVDIPSEHAYYTSDLESLLFTSYGFAVFNGETRYYYNVVDGKVIIYLQDPSSEDANEYGFVEDSTSFPSFSESIEYEGKTYYANDGFRLTFERAEGTEGQYPVLVEVEDDGTEIKEALATLYFTPSGGSEFAVAGTVYVGGDPYNNCTIVREQTEDGYEMYLRLPTMGGLSYYRFDISVDYRGSAAGAGTYTITGMRLISELPANQYLTLYYLVYLFYGSATANVFENSMGEISLMTDYDEAGVAGDPYLNFWLGETTGVCDANGEPFEMEKVRYESLGDNAYSASFTGADGYEYELLFVAAYNNYVGTYGFQLYALVRYQDFVDAETGITVTVGRVVGSEAFAAGSLFDVQLSKDGTPIEADWKGYIGEDVYFVTRTREEMPEGSEEEGKILSSTYYKIVLVEDTGEQVGEEDDAIIPVYASATLAAESAATYYTEDGGYVDIAVESNTVKLFVRGSYAYAVTESTYDEQTKTYTVTLITGDVYTILIEDGAAVVTEVPAEEEEQA